MKSVKDLSIIRYFYLMQALEFPRGEYYQIICKAGDQALRIVENDPSNYNGSRVMGYQKNNSDNGQIWMVEKVGQQDDHFEIVNCVSALIFDEDSKEIRLHHGKQKKDQLFAVVKAPVQAYHSYYWIQTSEKGNKAVQLEGIARVANFDPNNEAQLFRFEKVTNHTLQQSCVLINNMTGKALDVPGATFKKGERLLQWNKNKRWNQRWQFHKHGKGVIIKSALNGLVIDIAGESRDNGAKVVQWEQTGGSNQQWFPEPCGNGLYKFRSCHEPSLFLAIKKQDVDDGGLLEVSSDENPTMYWRCEGAHP